MSVESQSLLSPDGDSLAPDIVRKIAEHPIFQNVGPHCKGDRAFNRGDLLGPARMVSESWLRSTCARGSLPECVATMQSFIDAGANVLAIYATTPLQNERVIDAWRSRPGAVVRAAEVTADA